MFNNKKTKYKNLFIRLLSIFMVFLVVSPTIIEASNAYFLSFTLNPSAKSIVATTSLSDVGVGFDKHAEIATGQYYLYNTVHDGDGKVTSNNLQFMMNDNYESYKKNGAGVINIGLPKTLEPGTKDSFDKRFPKVNAAYAEKYKYTLPYSFPGVHAGTGWWIFKGGDADEARQGTSQDELQAHFVGDNLTNGFNRLLTIAYNAEHGNSDSVNAEKLYDVARKVANLPLSDSKYHVFGSGTNYEVTISASEYVTDGKNSVVDPDDPLSGFETSPYIDDDFYREFTITSDGQKQKIILPIAVNKGYDDSPDARMYDTIKSSSYFTSGKNKSDAYAITWQNMVMQAGSNASNGIFFSDVDELNPPGRIEKAILGMFSGITSGIRSMLGLNSITDLIYNQGVIKGSFQKGAIPVTMVPVVNFVYNLSLAIAIVIGMGSLLSLIIKSNLSIMNPQMRVDIKDGFMTIIGAMFILVLFKPVWNGLLELNLSFSNMFYALASNPGEFSELFAGGGGGFASFILSVAFLIVEIWFNFFYITRAITIMILYMFAPLMIIAISYGGKYKMIFSNWAKEIGGALFIQSIHAAVLSVLSVGISRGLATSPMWQYIILISIIPLSDLLRKGILGLGGDSLSSTASSGEKGLLMAGAVGTGVAMKLASSASNKGISMLAGNSTGGGPPGGGNGIGGRVGDGSGRTALGDNEATDMSTEPVETGADRLNEQREAYAGMTELSDLKGETPGKTMKNTMGAVGENLRPMKEAGADAIRGAAQKLDGQTGREARQLMSSAAGAVMTTAMNVGDLATDGGGSSQAAIIASGLMKKSGEGKHSGGTGGNMSRSSSKDYASPASIASSAHREKDLNKLRKQNKIGDQGALTLHQQSDGSQILSSDKATFMRDTGYTDIVSYEASEEFENGMTNFTYDSRDINHTNEELLSNAADITSRFHQEKQDGQLTDATAANYYNMRESTGMANVSVIGQNGKGDDIYSIDIDNQALGWHGTSTTENTFHVQAGQHANKQAPNFNEAKAQTLRMNNNMKAKNNEGQSVAQK